jgi:hypothetical protein
MPTNTVRQGLRLELATSGETPVTVGETLAKPESTCVQQFGRHERKGAVMT